ncbi:uncharacterized protein SPAPADRAFT_137351 [Spathaspora passalidarum NRRL Y-27907]|uniref:F-box domain-containing protein n=1 Tax=Spathaspora passalidarum (strain NRRL Y-27907 / 11-Y1) TaxID=619300 RepID=G3ALT8_SPAPN|nr:uncharacterized protein SPAPADRAFT_137351 [Spathaspora passalidarum NRRL Y-27907]EGW32697.1 hypothetical protein SPAPADRAFT_137351 [Spathaspora passalidarum NRRL Y-27907]
MQTENDNWILSFVRIYLPRIPDEVLIQIFNLLPFGYLRNFFLYFPDDNIRNLIIHYYSQQVHFVWSKAHFFLSTINFRFGKIFNRRTYEGSNFQNKEVFRFMDEFPEIVPRRLFVASEDVQYNPVNEVLKKFHNRIYNIDEIGIYFSKCPITIEDVDYVLSLQNLTELYFCGLVLTPIFTRLIDNLNLINHPKLRKIVISHAEDNDWSRIKLPETLKSLSFGNFLNGTNTSIVSFPITIQQLSINRLDIRDLSHLKHRISGCLTDLQLNLNRLERVLIDDLPPRLRVLDLSFNSSVKSITCDDPEATWPVTLEKLILSCSGLDDNVLEMINDNIGWPSNLIKLDLSLNKFTNINNLSNLPFGLQWLNLSNNRHIRVTENFQFSSQLKFLEMSGCVIDDIQYLEFPSSLEQLNLPGNQIRNILSYRDWGKLDKLHTFGLWSNRITSLNKWFIPPNLNKLDLRGNRISTLSKGFPLFNKHYDFNIVDLNLGQCKIKKIQIDYIPTSLTKVNLSRNKLSSTFLFPSAFKRLLHLDLSNNFLTSIVFENDNCKSCLSHLNLENNPILTGQKSPEHFQEFYDYLESNLGKVTERASNYIINFKRD